MKSLLASLSLGRSPDARFNLTAAIGSTMLRQMLSSALYFVALWVTTRQLGPHHNGLLVTALLLPQALYAVLNLGLASSHVYHMSGAIADTALMRRANWILAGALWGLAALALALGSDAMIGRYLPGTSKGTALYASLLFPAMLLAAWTVSMIQGARDYASFNKTALTQPLTFCAGVLALGALDAVSVASVLSCHILSQAALWLASEARVRRYPAALRGNAPALARMIGYGLRAHLSNVITFLNYRVGLYTVSLLLDPSSAGTYALSVQLAEALWLIAGAASVVVFPESAAASGTPAALRQMVGRIALTVLKITFVAGMLAAALSTVLIPLAFGKDYAGAVVPFIVLLPGIVTWSYMNVIANSLAGMGRQGVNILGASLSLVLNGAGCMLAVPAYGTWGAALAASVAFTATAAYTVFMYRRIMAKRIAQDGAGEATTPAGGDDR